MKLQSFQCRSTVCPLARQHAHLAGWSQWHVCRLCHYTANCLCVSTAVQHETLLATLLQQHLLLCNELHPEAHCPRHKAYTKLSCVCFCVKALSGLDEPADVSPVWVWEYMTALSQSHSSAAVCSCYYWRCVHTDVIMQLHQQCLPQYHLHQLNMSSTTHFPSSWYHHHHIYFPRTT